LSSTLVVPIHNIREHVKDISHNDYYGIRQQVEAFQRTNKKSSRMEEQSSLTPVAAVNYLPMHEVKIDSIGSSQININYLLIEAVQQTNISTFWNTIWTRNVSSIVMIYDINEDVKKNFDLKYLSSFFVFIEFICILLAR
jgi:hypothetical protein